VPAADLAFRPARARLIHSDRFNRCTRQ
jgi:hypothetical protein